MRRFRAFTLVELLVVISIIALLIGMLMPALGKARQSARTVQCLSNIRSMEVAHCTYMTDNNGRFVNAGLSHSGGPSAENAEFSWIKTLDRYYGDVLVRRSPSDDSPHWTTQVTGVGRLRTTSYGINNFVADVVNSGSNPHGAAPAAWNSATMGIWPGGDGAAFNRIERILKPSATVHFLMMAYTGSFAASDHVHADDWMSSANPYFAAAAQAQTNAHGGDFRQSNAISNWGFLDGHAETAPMSRLIRMPNPLRNNSFNPMFAQ